MQKSYCRKFLGLFRVSKLHAFNNTFVLMYNCTCNLLVLRARYNECIYLNNKLNFIHYNFIDAQVEGAFSIKDVLFEL